MSLSKVADHHLVRNVRHGLALMLNERMTRTALLILVTVILLGAFGQHVSPYSYDEQHLDENGQIERLEPPSADHWLGTTYRGEDVFSRVVYGARPTMITGLVGGAIIIAIGSVIGITAGFVGGTVEGVLMRFTDFIYGIPILPFAITLAAIIGIGFWTVILIIGALLWRASARVLRSQVLQIKQQPYVRSAEAMGASTPYIIYKHVLPNVAGMAVLFFALGIGYAILFQASLAFLGVSNPFIPTWGVMIRNAYSSGTMATAWWWSMPPGIMISITVLSTFLLGRGYETVSESKGQ